MEAGIFIPSHKKSGKNLMVCGEIAPFQPISRTHMQEIGQKLVGVSWNSPFSARFGDTHARNRAKTRRCVRAGTTSTWQSIQKRVISHSLYMNTSNNSFPY